MRFANRSDAGQQLAVVLLEYQSDHPVVLALPRGGVVVGAEIARRLQAPLGVVVVHKISHPLDPEYAIGAIAEHEAPVYDRHVYGIAHSWWREMSEAVARVRTDNRHKLYGRAGDMPDIAGRTVIVVDDGLATGLSMRAAVLYVAKYQPKRIIVAAPVASLESIATLAQLISTLVLLDSPEHFYGAVGMHYDSFEQTTDEEVITLLQEAQRTFSSNNPARSPSTQNNNMAA